MRHRRWVIVAAVLIIAVLPITLLAMKIGSRRPAFKRAVLARIIPEVDAELSIGELELGLASLNFSDVTIDLGESGLVEIPAASVSVSYRKLLASGGSIRSSLGSVILSRPRVTLDYGGRGNAASSGDSSGKALALLSYLPDYMGVSDAALTLRDRETGRSFDVESVDLLLQRERDGTARGSAVGDVLGGVDNMKADFSCDCEASWLRLVGRLSDGRLKPSLPLPGSLPFVFDSGTLNATVEVAALIGEESSLAGSLAVSDGRVLAGGGEESVRVDALDARLTDGRVIVDEARGEWRAADWSASGSVDVVSGSVEGLDLHIERAPLAAIADHLEGVPSVEGLATIEAAADGPFDNLRALIGLQSSGLYVGDTPLTNVSASAIVTSDAVDLGRLRTDVFGGSVSVSGRVGRDDGDGPWFVDLVGSADSIDVEKLPDPFRPGEASGRVSFTDLEVRGRPGDLDAEALVSWTRLSIGSIDVGPGAGGFLLRNGSMAASLASRDGGFSLGGEVDDFFGDPVVDAALELSGVVMDSFWTSAPSVLHGVELRGDVLFRGPVDSPGVSGTVDCSGGGFEGTVSLNGGVAPGPDGPELTLGVASSDARVRAVELPFEGEVKLDRETLSVFDLRAGEFLEASVSVGIGRRDDLSGSLVVSEAALGDVLALGGISVPEGVDGLLFASASMTGTLEDPDVSFQVHAGNARAAGVGDLDATLVGAVSGDLVTVREFELREGGRSFVEAEGRAVVGGELEFSIRGDGVPGPFLGGSADSRFDVTAGLGGTTDGPTVDARVESGDGVFLGMPFDSFVARVTGVAGSATLSPLALERTGVYRVSVEGSVPYGAILGRRVEGEGGLTIDVDGDPLALIAELSPLLTSADGEGRMNLHLVGGRDGVTVARATLEATARSVTPAAVFEEIEDVTVSASVRDGVLTTGFIEGLVDDRSIRVESQRGRVVDGRMLYPFIVGGLDVGILALSTSQGGVRVNIPGLMLEDEYGNVAARGRGDEPAFLVSGPPEHPLLWGELLYSDISFTYPFVRSESRIGGDFLSRAEWSVLMTAGRNVWYWRPDVNLAIERGGSLDLVGIPQEHSMCISGRLYSSNGTVAYLNNDFSVTEAFAEFPAFCEPPRFSAEATMRVDDGTEITLELNPTEAAQAFAAQGAPLSESAITLSSDDPDDTTQQEVLARLTYGGDYEALEGDELAAIERRTAIEVVGSQIGGMVVRPLLSPIEARIRRGLRLDRVRIDIDFIEQFLAQLDRWTAQEGSYDYTPFLAKSRLTLGKYIWSNWLLSYVGLAEAYEEEIGYQSLGLRHELGIEYEVSRNTSLSLKAVYDPALAGWDRRITIENRYEF